MARGCAAAGDMGECFGITQPLMKDAIRDAGTGWIVGKGMRCSGWTHAGS